MPGFGFGTRLRSRLALPPPVKAQITPGATWTGVAGSGYVSPPADPVRTTAKPVLRPLMPPAQRFTDTLMMGVYAGANNGGTLLDNMGLSHVRVYCEGNTFDIAAPTRRTLVDANGNPHTYFGWWCDLKHDGRIGVANVYFEAVPSDATMQSRVIGPITYYPSATQYELDLEIAPSQAVVAGVRYQDWSGAANYARSQGIRHCRFHYVEAGVHDLGDSFGIYLDGYVTIEASVPVTFRRASAAFVAGGSNAFRPKSNCIHFKGGNITIDFANSIELYTDPGAKTVHYWFDGCTLTNSDGIFSLWRKRTRNVLGFLVRNGGWFTECSISQLWNCCANASLARGCTVNDSWNDIFGDALCVLGNIVSNHDHNDLYRADIDALSVTYTGAEATASIAISLPATYANRVVTAKWGANTQTFTIDNSEAGFVADTNYTLENLAAWINGLAAGWSATVLDGTYFAAALHPGGWGSVLETSVKDTVLTLKASFDIHSDFYQKADAGTLENIVVADNSGVTLDTQDLFFSGALNDVLALNNAFANDPTSGLASQLNRVHSHVVVAHNSCDTQGLLLRSDLLCNPDGYCLVANNALAAIQWNGAADGDLAIAGNHLHAGASNPSGATGTSIGGDETSLFVDSAGGDFTPAGALASNLKVPVVKRDRYGAARGATAAAGAVA